MNATRQRLLNARYWIRAAKHGMRGPKNRQAIIEILFAVECLIVNEEKKIRGVKHPRD